MNPKPKQIVIAMFVAAALAMPATAVLAQQQEQPRQQQQQQARDLRTWDIAVLYTNTWSAEQMIGTDVRNANGKKIGEVKDIIVGSDGKISRIVAEVGGFLEIADQHIGVPWRDVTIGPGMKWVQVPLEKAEEGLRTYSLYGRVPQGETVSTGAGAWRVGELIGDYASLEDVARYGMVTDVIFNLQGEPQGVIVNRTAGSWGPAGWYGYPWYGYHSAYAYPLPHRGALVRDYGRFDYVVFADRSTYAGSEKSGRSQARTSAGERSRGAAGPTGSEKEQESQ